MAKTKPETVAVELDPSYFKKGDDWSAYLKGSDGDVVIALRAWANNLDESAAGLRAVANALVGVKGLAGDGDTHYAEINGVPEKLVEDLLKASDGTARLPDVLDESDDELDESDEA